MPVKIRLQRHGKKGKPYFHIVVADARAPRDGKYIERLGFYNPNTNPATIDIDVDGAVKWLGNGAQPTDTAKAILSYKGVLYKTHLLKGVQKGAFSTEEADKRFNSWLDEKNQKIENKKKGLSDAESNAAMERLKAEKEVNQTRAAAIAAANTPEPEAPAEVAPEESAPEAEASAEAPATEEVAVEEPKAEAPKAEEPKVEEKPAVEEPKEETPTDAPEAEEKPAVEEPKAETKVEEPKEEEAPKAEKQDEKTSTEEAPAKEDDKK